jgi:hypothetical protein
MSMHARPSTLGGTTGGASGGSARPTALVGTRAAAESRGHFDRRAFRLGQPALPAGPARRRPLVAPERWLLTLAFIALAIPATAQPVRRALLIGIDEYTASTLPVVGPKQHSGWPDLQGSANDVRILAEMLVLRYGFARKNIVTLTNQQATRDAILRSIEQHLIRPARKGDVVFYYFAGHGAQVPNAASDEPDRLDESIVPADSRRGAADIRDKELRPLFNRILDRGAYLTLLLDHCHSGGGFRGLPNGSRPRGVAPAPPIVDRRDYGPRPDERGALVLVSTQDLDSAWETRGDDGLMHGAFTWAWIRAMRDAVAGEPAQETFLRAQARLRGETPYQAPAMLGGTRARLRPFLGTRNRARAEHTVVAVERVNPDGDVILQAGWAHGLVSGSELAPIGDRRSRLHVTQVLGLGRSVARMNTALPASIRSGALLEVVAWAAPQGRPLRIWAPRAARDLPALARRFAAATSARWIIDPLEAAPTHLLRPRENGWELLDREGSTTALANDDAAAAAIARLHPADSLFVQLPAAEAIAGADGIALVDHPQDADYLLAGRFHRDRVEYAWIRPLVRNSDRRASGLPQRTAWTTDPIQLRRDLVTLRRIQSWFTLTPPPDPGIPYRLAVRDQKTRQLVHDVTIVGGRVYDIVLRAPEPPPAQLTRRHYYVFVVDSYGNSHLVFPRTGSVENRFPIGDSTAADIALGDPSAFRISRPYGLDTYFLLSTEEPLPNPSILEWDGVRARRALTATRWSIERITFESIATSGRLSKRP